MNRIISLSDVKPPSKEHSFAVEKAFRRGVKVALNAAYRDPILRSADAADIAVEMLSEWIRGNGEAEEYRQGYADEISRRVKSRQD
jgi:hypothetical protein